MTEIISYAKGKNIEIVPLLNMPGHMDGILSSDKYSEYKLSGSEGSLDLNNENAVAFGKELLTMYVEYFKTQGCKFFNFGADEYGQGIRNPYIESSVAAVKYNQLIDYMNACAEIIENAGMTARCFNDFVCYNNRTSCDLKKSVQVCYWSNQWNGSEYNTVDVINDAGYKLINTNQKWYFVPSKADEYGKATVLDNFKTFDVTKFQNIKSGWNSTSTTYSQITGGNNVGAMFCVWCDTPSVVVDLSDVKELIAAMADANPTYFTKVTIPNTTVGNATTADSDTVRVTGPNLAKLECKNASVEIQGAAEGKIAAYNVTPSTADSKYTEKAEVRIKIPAEWDKTKVKAFIIEDGTAKDIADGKVDGEWYVFTAPHFSVMGIYEQDVTYVEDTVTVVVGSSETVTIEGYDYSEQVGEIDTSIATVKVTYEGVTVSEFTPATSISNNAKYIVKYGDKYIDENGKLTDNISEAAEWTYERYNNTYGKLKNSKDQYLTYQSNGSFTTVQGYNNNSWLYVNGTTVNMHDGSGYNIALSLGTKTEGSSQPSTIITFTGVKEGTTSVVIGGTRYTVKVVDATLAQQVLPINLWITNTGVVPTGWGTSYNNVTREGFTYGLDTLHTYNGWETFRAIYELKATEGSIHSEQGVKLSELIPNKGKAYGYRGSNTPEEYNVDIWKCSYNASAERQSTDGWTNSSNKGTEFEYIRYWDNKWEYCSAKTGEWTEVGEVGAGKDDSGKNQVCVWYRQVTTVTSEVTTEIVDWGPIKYAANQCLLDFAVKYDGTANRIPNSFPVTGKTIGFDIAPIDNVTYYGTDNGAIYRTVYGIAGVETLNYEVYMITVTPTSDTHTDYVTKGTKPTELNYGGTEKIAWAKTEADANSTELNKMPNVEYGGEPFLESVKIYQYQGLLVTYYLRAKQTPDSLTVHYAIQGSETAFYEYNIAVDRGTTFDSGIALDNSQDPYVGGPLLNGRVTNSNGETITVSSNLATLQGLEPQYRYSKYEIVGFRKDDKNVWIYYTFTREHTYVIDFGLPLKIKFSDFGVTNDADIKTVSLWEKKIVHENKGLYGTAKVITGSTEGKYVLYTLDKPLDKNITIPLYVKFNQRGDNDKPQLFTANIIPATNVYYEDSFAKFNHGAGAAASAMWTPVYDPGTDANTNANTTQALEALGQTDHNPYGYDPAYQNSTMFSMGSAQKVTVTSDMAKDGVVWPTAQFTFKGTGFDIISLTDNTSGAIFVDVYNTNTGNKEKSVFVDNYYGYTYNSETNTWDATPEKNNVLYQIPVIALRNLSYAEHNVVIKVAYSEYFDHTAEPKGSYSFWLDAVRVYDPMGVDNDIYNTGNEKEGYPQYIKLRDELAKTENTTVEVKSMVFIDGGNTADIATYANIGPNNEVYLANGQAITFKLAGDLSNIATVQIGAKAPVSGGTAQLNVNGTGVVENGLSTATEMYYNIKDKMGANNTFTISNTGSGILSLTNLKITFNAKGSVSLGAMNAEEQTASVMAVRALFAPAPVEPEPEPEPEKTFEPERFEASWTKNVMQGRKATLTVKTSEDVEAITVDGQTIRSYRTRTERVGFGRRAKRITYREFTYSMVAQESADFSVTAINAEGTESEAITARLTVKTRPNSMRDMWDWFKGWF